MWKNKLLIQTCVCLIIFGGLLLIDKTESQTLIEKKQSAVASMSKHYTVSDIWESGKAAASAVIKAPAVVTSYIISSQDMQEYGIPVDETIEGETASVYAVAGGQVVEAGENEEFGKYLKIRHQTSVSTYGNCKKLYVKEGEHVRKGQVIASFYKDENGDFYYDLTELEP